jgi:hypothetical protein
MSFCFPIQLIGFCFICGTTIGWLIFSIGLRCLMGLLGFGSFYALVRTYLILGPFVSTFNCLYSARVFGICDG